MRAYKDACKRKRRNTRILEFDIFREEHLDDLCYEILEREYRIQPTTCFLVREPVLREIVAANFRDRIVHHYIYNYLYEHLERYLIFDCYSCRIGKGTLFGVKRLSHHIRAVSDNYQRDCYVLQMDIQGYFMSIRRDILLAKTYWLLDKVAKTKSKVWGVWGNSPHHEWVRYLLECVIMSNPLEKAEVCGSRDLWLKLPKNKSLYHAAPLCGLPIGNLTSQLFSNLYLNDFDHWVKNVLDGCQYYGRYVDDFYIVSEDKKRLKEVIPVIYNKLYNDLGLMVHPWKTKIVDASKGVTFLGKHLKPFRTYISKATYGRMCRRLENAEKDLGYVSFDVRTDVADQVLARTNSYLGMLRHTTSYKIRSTLFRDSVIERIAVPVEGYYKYNLSIEGL